MATSIGRQRLSEVEATCGLLLNELQLIWDEVGETDEERDQLVLELEQECLEVYRRKVDLANRSRASLHQRIADMHSEIVALASALGDRPPTTQLESRGISLKEKLSQLNPILEELTRKKDERTLVFQEIRTQIHRIQCEIAPSLQPMETPVLENDLTQRKLEELQAQLQILQKEKNDRLYDVVEKVDTIHNLCVVLGFDFYATVGEIHPSLGESSDRDEKSISNETLNLLATTIQSLQEEKRRRMQKIQDLGASLLELWNLMDTPVEEQQEFRHVTCNIAAAEHEVFTAEALSLRVLEHAEAEVERLEHLKASKMKELVLKKQSELEEVCRKAHIIPDGHMGLDTTIASMESGIGDPADLLASIEGQIANVKEEALSRQDIMERIDKWVAACEEESWLEEYNKDENRYNATRGAHLNLKRAERARAAVSKIPALMENLILKTTAWEKQKGKLFLYDGVRLLSTIEEYNILRIEKEEERRRQRDQKRLHEQLINEQETLFGTKPSPNGRTPMKKGVASSRLHGGSTPASRRISLGGAILQQELATVGRQTAITPARIEQRPTGGMLQHESPAAARLSGITPGKNGPTPPPAGFGKESRIKAAQTPTSVNRILLPPEEEDSLPSQGKHNLKPTTNFFATPRELDDHSSSVPRMPLSPVSTPGMRPNTYIERQAASTATSKTGNSMMKSPLSALAPSRPAATVFDEENTTPPKQTALQQQQHIGGVQQSQPQNSPMIFAGPYPRPHEYSFEEKRLAHMHHYQTQYVNTWTDCR